jgi:hypothetical protein
MAAPWTNLWLTINDPCACSAPQHNQVEVIRFIMEKLRETAAHYVGDDVDSAVLTAPAWWTDEQKAVLVKVFKDKLHVGCRALLRSAS